VWAFGLLVFAMLVGHSFWRAAEGADGTIPRLMSEILHDPLALASSRAAEYAVRVPDGFDAWFARAVARDPAARFPNARVAFDALAPLLRAPSVATPVEAPPPGRGAALVVVALGVLVVLAAIGAGVVYTLARGRSSKTLASTATAPASAPASASASASATATATAAARAGASAGASASAPEPAAMRMQLNATVIPTTGPLHDGLFDQLNVASPRLDACFAGNASATSHGTLSIQLEVAAGHVTSANVLSQATGPAVPCLLREIRALALSPQLAGHATLILTWSPAF